MTRSAYAMSIYKKKTTADYSHCHVWRACCGEYRKKEPSCCQIKGDLPNF